MTNSAALPAERKAKSGLTITRAVNGDDPKLLLDSHHSPVASWLILAIALLLAGCFGWSAWAAVEEVVRAQGRIEPEGRVKIINHPQGGRVERLHVGEGAMVEKGEVLLVLDPKIDESERSELEAGWQRKSVEVERLQAEAAGRELSLDDGLVAARPELAARERELMAARDESVSSRRKALEDMIESRQGQMTSARADVTRLQNSLSLLRQQADAVRELAERGLYPKLKYVEIERQVAETEGELERARGQAAAARAALAESQSNLATLDKDRRRDILKELAAATAERDALRERLDTKESVLADLSIEAPVSGVVQDLVLTANGQSIGANEPIMKIVPLAEDLVVEAHVANRDIGRIERGMPATIKVRAFDFARFGSIEGEVARIAADAGEPEDEAPPSFAVRVIAERPYVGARPTNALMPGMIVDVEFKVGERTILSYLTETIIETRERAFRDG